MNKKLDAILGEKKEDPKEVKKDESQIGGCNNASEEKPKVEDSLPSSLPQYTQSLGAIEKGYSLDDVFARLKGGK